MFLASRIQWYTCVAGPYCAASCIHSQCAPGSGKKKCTTTEGSLRTYCPINLLWVYNYDIHCKSPLLCTCLEALQVYQTGHTNYVCSMHVSSVRKSRVYIHQSCPTIEEAAIPPITMSLIKKSHLQPQPPQLSERWLQTTEDGSQCGGLPLRCHRATVYREFKIRRTSSKSQTLC